MRRAIPPICFLLALCMLVVGFAMLAIDGPQPSVSLHQARATNDQVAKPQLEARLESEQIVRVSMIGFLLVGGCGLIVVGFQSMKP